MNRTRRGFLKFFGIAVPAVVVTPLSMLAERPIHYHEKRTIDMNEGRLVISKEECRDLKCDRPILDVKATVDSWSTEPSKQWEEITEENRTAWNVPSVEFDKNGDRIDDAGNKMFQKKFASWLDYQKG